MLQEGLRLQQVVLAEGYIRQVDGSLRAVRIDIGSGLHHLIIFVTTLREGLCHIPQLTQGELIRLGLVDLLCLFQGELLVLERNLVVGAAQVRIDIPQQVLVLCGISLLDLLLLRVGFQREIINDTENLVTVWQRCRRQLLHRLTQSVPVLRCCLRRCKDISRKVVSPAHIVGQRLRTVVGKHLVMLVRALRRCPSVNLDLLDGDILVSIHHVKGIGNLTKLTIVVHIVGLHLPAVHHESDEGSAMQVTDLLLRSRNDIHEMELRDELKGCRLREQRT